MQYGDWNTLTEHSVHGTATSFYVWVRLSKTPRAGSASNWIKGKVAFEEYNKLVQFYEKDKKQFILKVEELHSRFAPQKRK